MRRVQTKCKRARGFEEIVLPGGARDGMETLSREMSSGVPAHGVRCETFVRTQGAEKGCQISLAPLPRCAYTVAGEGFEPPTFGL